MFKLVKQLFHSVTNALSGGDVNNNYNLRCMAIDVLQDLKVNPGRFFKPEALKKKMEDILSST